jgi:hypothetical protein
MSKKKILLFGLTAAAAAAIAAPASASALMLYYSEAPIEKAIPVEMGGSLNWTTSGGSGVDCHGKTTITAETVDAKVTGVDIETLTCVGTGAYKGCKVRGHKATNLPWTAHLTANGFLITKQDIDYELECPFIVNTGITVGEVTATVNNASAIKTMKLSGTGTSGLETATISGEFEVLGEAAGKLKIAE